MARIGTSLEPGHAGDADQEADHGKDPGAKAGDIGSYPKDESHIGGSCGKLGTTALACLSARSLLPPPAALQTRRRRLGRPLEVRNKCAEIHNDQPWAKPIG